MNKVSLLHEGSRLSNLSHESNHFSIGVIE